MTLTEGMMHLIWTILIGFVVGLLARFLMPGDDKMGFFMTAALGIAGSLVATYAGLWLGWYAAGEGAGFIASLIGAIVLLIVYHVLRRRTT
jgi:uncharacterized membrane protein YeaQ/YmgE (transglycosylase-associated protein family)